MRELISTINFDHISATGQIRYDVEKLRWVNHKWINLIEEDDLISRCKPYLLESFPLIAEISEKQLKSIISKVKTEMVTLKDCMRLLAFYFAEPTYNSTHAATFIDKELANTILSMLQNCLIASNAQECIETFKSQIAIQKISTKQAFMFVRYILTGSEKGLGISELIEIMPYELFKQRINTFTW